MEKMDYKKKTYKIVFFAAIIYFFCTPQSTHAAMLTIVPSSGTYNVGDVFSVSVKVSSYAEAMNAVSGTLSYPKDTLSIISVSKNSSIITTWLPPGATGPISSTSAGTVSFEGVLIGGYSGGPKTVFTATFKVKKSGTAKLSFKNGTILANDGKGTDLTEALKSASYKLAVNPALAVTGSVNKSKSKTQKPTSVPPENLSNAPQVVDITPVVAPAASQLQNTVSVEQKNTSTFFESILQNINFVILIGLGLVIVLVISLFIRISRLTKMVKDLQTKRASPRRKKIGFSSQKISPRAKSNNTILLRGVGNK